MSAQSPSKRPASCVLLVDDRADQLAVRARGLEADGRTVVVASTRMDATRSARTEKPDVAIVELFLGRQDGLDCVRELKAIRPDLFVVVSSGDMSVAYAMAAVRAGADDVFVEPVDVPQLLRRIEHGESIDPQRTSLTLDQVEWEHISRALLESGKNITQAAERLGIYRQTLQRKLRKRGRERANTESGR